MEMPIPHWEWVFAWLDYRDDGTSMADLSDSAASPSPQRGAADLAGRTLGDYRLLRSLGRGAMAEVYLAEQLSLGRNVAFKVLKSDLATDATYVERFLREARAAAALVHPNIVQVYEVGQREGMHYIAQEYVPGQNLAELLTRSGPPELPLAVAIMRQVSAALAKAGAHGIVHRDIKPENLMLTATGEVKVADFGLARVTEAEGQPQLTQVGMTMGSPLYMSPEQIEGKRLDPRSDIYSLGVTSFEMLAGQTPFRGESTLNVAMQHLQSEPERLENLRSDLPAGLCRIVHRMLAKDPKQRFANGIEVLGELKDLNIKGLDGEWPEELEQFNTTEMVALTEARAAATQQLSAVMASEETPRPLTRHPFFWVAIAVALLFGMLLGWPRSEPPLLAEDLPTGVERMPSAEAQYLYAMHLGSEEGWQSVIEHFPSDQYHLRLARKQLSEVYLNQDRRYEAFKIYGDFINEGDAEPEYRAYGLAGQYVIMVLDQEMDAAGKVFAELWPLRVQLKKFDRGMTRRVFQLARKNKRAIDREKQAEIDEWLERHTQSDRDPDPGQGEGSSD